MTSTHAACAAAIRKELKAAFPNEKFNVRARTASMMTAVDVYIGDYVETEQANSWGDKIDQSDVMKKANQIVSKYKYGHFDGMTDSYEYSNNRKDIPQVKYVSVRPFSRA